MSVVPFVTPSPSDDTTTRYVAQANAELQSVQQGIAAMTAERDDLNAKIAVDEQRVAELQRLIADMQNP